jgi:hemolysin III
MVTYRAVAMDSVELPTKPRLRGWLHTIAFFVSVPAGISLVAFAGTAAAKVSASIYALSLSGLYGVSAAFHRLPWAPASWARMRRLDHSMIFVLIAGTYTPYALLVLPAPWSTTVLVVVWAGAFVGITLRLATGGMGALQQTLYLSLGWIAVFTLPLMLREMGWVEIALLFVGGIFYTAGAIMFALHRPDPNPAVFGYHEVWHSMVIGGSLCHYVLVLLLIVRG